MLVLGIETSCDETGIALYDSEQGLLADVLYSQIELHARYGGVVPELASRDHIRKVIPLVDAVIAKAGITKTQIEGVAYTSGPGLVGALLVGAMVGRTLGFAWNVPAIGVHHMEAHLLAPMLADKKPEFPFVALLVSGGHTMLVEVQDFGKYILLGESLDDAAGEAFDKVAKLLGLPYPGGPQIARLALTGDNARYHFPRPMTDRPGLDFSFSGLKTYTVNTFKRDGDDFQTKADIAAAFQAAVVDTLVVKCRRALEQTHLSRLVVAGGVSANELLRHKLRQLSKKIQVEIFYPPFKFCADNGAMIAYCGCQHLLAGRHDGLEVNVCPRWNICTVTG